jgi:hypothetical protein
MREDQAAEWKRLFETGMTHGVPGEIDNRRRSSKSMQWPRIAALRASIRATPAHARAQSAGSR